MLKQRFEYKEQAQGLLVGKYEPTIIVLVVFGVIQGLINVGADQFSAKGNFDWTTMEWIITQQGNPFMHRLFNILSFVLSAYMAYALIKMFIGLARDQMPDVKDVVLSGFKNDPFKILALQFLTSLFVFLWTLLLIIPGIVKAYAYSMNFYLLHREPKLSAMEAIDKSKNITMGYKMELLMLDLSYLGWYLLGIFTLGILWLWIIPKHQTARVLYFDEIYIQRVTSLEAKLISEFE